MDVQVKQINDVAVLTLSGNIDALSAPRITELIQKQIADFQAVDYTCSAGLRMLLRAIK